MANYQSYDEKSLIKGLQKGDSKAFTEIYNRFWKLLFGIAYKYMGSKQQAEEITQDIFMRLWDRREDLEIQSLGPYLATACKYGVFKQIAKDKLRREKLNGEVAILQTTATEIESTIEAKFLEEVLSTTVNKLPGKCRLVYKLSEEEHLKVPEIARQLQISPNTARNHLARAREIIRSSLKEAGATLLLF